MALEIQFDKERHPIRWIIVIIIVGLLITAGWFSYKWYTTGETPEVPFVSVVSADNSIDETTISPLSISTYTVENLTPRYISIPALDIPNTRIKSVVLNDLNILQFPTNIHDAGWYEKSSNPGTGGVVIINGHNKGVKENGVFSRIKELKADDLITIERGDSEKINYKVVSQESVPVNVFNETTSKSLGTPVIKGEEGLNIVTFDGKWVPKTGTFENRILLKATIVE